MEPGPILRRSLFSVSTFQKKNYFACEKSMSRINQSFESVDVGNTDSILTTAFMKHKY